MKSEELYSVSSIGVLPFIEGSLGDGTSGLVARSRDNESWHGDAPTNSVGGLSITSSN